MFSGQFDQERCLVALEISEVPDIDFILDSAENAECPCPLAGMG